MFLSRSIFLKNQLLLNSISDWTYLSIKKYCEDTNNTVKIREHHLQTKNLANKVWAYLQNKFGQIFNALLNLLGNPVMYLMDSFWFVAFAGLIISLNYCISWIIDYVKNKSPGFKVTQATYVRLIDLWNFNNQNAFSGK